MSVVTVVVADAAVVVVFVFVAVVGMIAVHRCLLGGDVIGVI